MVPSLTGPSPSRLLAAAVFLAAGSGVGAVGAPAQEVGTPADTIGVKAERIQRADSIRAAMVRPQRSPEPGISQRIASALTVLAAPIELVGRGAVAATQAVLPAVRAVETELGEHDLSLELAKIGPQSGPAAILRFQRPEGPFLEAAYSVNASRLYGAGVRLAGPGPGAGAGLEASARYVRHAQPVFWGVGPGSPESAAADYRWDRFLYTVAGRLPLGERTLVRGGAGYERNQVADGGDPGLPDVPAVFGPPAAPGVEAETDFARLEAGLSLDGIRWKLIQRSGVAMSLDGAVFLGVDGTPVDFYRVTAEAQGVLPLTSRHAIASRLLAETNRTISGGAIPFTHLASLGSIQGLRSYPRDRFRDQARVALMSEYRYEIWRDREISLGAEGVVFLDVGGVERRLSALAGEDLRTSYGFGLRVVRSADLEALAYVAFGDEGTRADLRFDWPF